MESFLRGLLSALPLMMVLGPVSLLLLDTGVRHGRRAIAGAGAVATADLCLGMVAWLGGAALARTLNRWQDVLVMAAAGFMVLIAGRLVWQVWSERHDLAFVGAPAGAAVATSPSARAVYGRFFGMCLVHPLSLVGMTALVLGSGGGRSLSVAWVVGVAGASLLAHGSYALVGWRAGGRIAPQRQAQLRLFGAGIIVVIAASWMI